MNGKKKLFHNKKPRSRKESLLGPKGEGGSNLQKFCGKKPGKSKSRRVPMYKKEEDHCDKGSIRKPGWGRIGASFRKKMFPWRQRAKRRNRGEYRVLSLWVSAGEKRKGGELKKRKQHKNLIQRKGRCERGGLRPKVRRCSLSETTTPADTSVKEKVVPRKRNHRDSR